MSEKDIKRWHEAVTPYSKAPQPWSIKSGGSWDMLDVQPIPDDMLAELAQRYHYSGAPWNCRSMPLSDGDREYMYLLYYSMQGLVSRMIRAERQVVQADQRGDEAMRRAHAAEAANEELAMLVRKLVSTLKVYWPHAPQPEDLPSRAIGLLRRLGLMGSPLRTEEHDGGGAKAVGDA